VVYIKVDMNMWYRLEYNICGVATGPVR
jgi:hypothetical protein